MIQSVEIKGLRGIREGKLTDLTPLVVLVGPNGCGKSTVLDAILMGASPFFHSGLEAVVHRHARGGAGPRWLFWRAGDDGPAGIFLKTRSGKIASFRLQIEPNPPGSDFEIRFSQELPVQQFAIVSFPNGLNTNTPYHPSNLEPEVNLIEPYWSSSQQPLAEVYTDVVRKGRRRMAVEIFSELVPGVIDIRVLMENGQPILHFEFEDHSVPASVAGDGIHSLLHQTLQLAASSGGVALLEEPEVHKHPAAIHQCALAILAAVRSDIQVILTTHSLELIDSLLSACSDDDLKLLSLYRLLLQEGKLISSRLDGADIAFGRLQIEDDLR